MLVATVATTTSQNLSSCVEVSCDRVKGIRRDARGRADMAGPERWWKSCGALKCRVLTYARRDVQTRRAASGRSPQRCFELAGPCELKIFSHPRDFVASIQLYFPTPSLLLWRSFPGSSPDWTCYFALWLPSCPLHSVNSYSLLGSFLSWCLASEW